MYGIFTYIWVIDSVNVGKYPIHGAYGKYNLQELGLWPTNLLLADEQTVVHW